MNDACPAGRRQIVRTAHQYRSCAARTRQIVRDDAM